MQPEKQLILDLMNSSLEFREKKNKFESSIQTLAIKDFEFILAELLTEEKLSTSNTKKWVSCFIFLFKVKKDFVQNPEMAKFFVKFVFELIKQKQINKKTSSFKKLSQLLKEITDCEQNNSMKFIILGIQKSDEEFLDALCQLLNSFALNNSSIIDAITKRVQKTIGSLDKKQTQLYPSVLEFIDESTIKKDIIPVLKKEMSKGNYSLVNHYLSQLRDSQNIKIGFFEDLLENSIIETINKTEDIYIQSFGIIKTILSSNYYKDPKKISMFLENMAKKMFKKESPSLCNCFCELISSINYTNIDTYQKIFEQYFENNQFVTTKQQELIKKTFLQNQSISKKSEILEFILNSLKIKKLKCNYTYDLLYSINDNSTLQLKEILSTEKTALLTQLQQQKDHPISIQNYQQFIYGVIFNKDTISHQEISSKLLNKQSFFFNKNFYNIASIRETELLFKILILLSQQLETQWKESSLFSLMVFKLMQICEKNKLVEFKLSQFLLQVLLMGTFTYCLEIELKKQEKLSPFLINFICEQECFSQMIENQKYLILFLKVISFGDFKYPLKKHFIKHFLIQNLKNYSFGQKIDIKTIQFIFNQENIINLEEDTRKKYQEFLSYLLYFSPNILSCLSKMYHKNLLNKITRIERIIDGNKQLKKGVIWNLTTDQFEALKTFGYRELEIQQIQNETINLLQILKDEIHLEETDDEKYQELEAIERQEKVIEEYYKLMHQITDAISLFSCKFKSDLKEPHSKQLQKLNKNLHESVLESQNLKNLTEKTFEKVFEMVIIAENSQLNGLSSVYCYVIKNEVDGKIFAQIEEFINKLNPEVYKKFDLRLFNIFLELFKYLVNCRLEVEHKKKIFELLYNSLETFKDKKQEIFIYIGEHINELYFPSCFEFLEKFLNEESLSNPKIIDLSLLHFLSFEDFAIKLYLNNAKSAMTNSCEQQIEPYQKLKLLLMTESQNEEIKNLSEELISKHQSLKFEVADIKNIDFKQIIYEMPADLHGLVNRVLQKLFENLTDKKLQDEFVEKLLSEFIKFISEGNQNLSNEQEERLQLFPNILSTLLNYIDDKHILNIFECLVQAEKCNYTTLTQNGLNLGLQLIVLKQHMLKQLLDYFQIVLKTEKGLISPLIFIGECTKIDQSISKSFKDMEMVIIKLIDHENINFHKNLSLFLRNLIMFFKDPKNIVINLIDKSQQLTEPIKIHIRTYFISGLLKGLGIKYIDKLGVLQNIKDMFDKSSKRDLREFPIEKRYFAIYMLESLWFVFKKLLEPKMNQIIQMLVQFLGDFDFQIREQTKKVLDDMMKNMSNYSIKLSIPILLTGTEDKNWRTKLNSIQGLAAVSYCGIKQLSENLPIIVPKLTLKVNDTNEEIREASLKSLSLILSTIKNPEISEIRDIIIKSLSDPYQDNDKSLDALLNIRFRHYIDGASLSLIMPILTYGLKNAKASESKIKAAKIVANIFSLIQNDSDIWPHIENLIGAMQCALKDVDNDVRALTSKAFKSVGVRFPNLCNFMLNKLKATLVDENTISIAKSGNAQAFAEVLSTQDQQTVENILQNMIDLTQDKRDYVRESFLSVFVYLPIVFGKKFSKYVKATTDIVVESISSEVEILRNLAIKSIKMLIHNFFDAYVDYFVDILYEKSIDEDPVVRKSAQILVGDVIEVLIEQNDDREQVYTDHSKVFGTLYIMKNDSNADVRFVSNNIFKNFIENTPKCIKKIFGTLMEIFMDLYKREGEHYQEIANHGYKEFIQKYGNNYFNNILNYMIQIKNQGKVESTRSISILVKYFVLYLNKSNLNKIRVQNISDFLTDIFKHEDDEVWKNAVSGMRFLSEITNGVSFLRKVIKKLITDLENPDELEKIKEDIEEEQEDDEEEDQEQEEEKSEEKQDEEKNEEKKDDEEEQIEEEMEEEKLIQQEQVEKVEKSEEEESNDDEEGESNDDSQISTNPLQDKLVNLLCELLMSDVIKIVNFANDFVFLNCFKEWQVQIIIINARVYGSLLYSQKEIKEGLKFFLEFYEENQEIEFQDLYLFMCTEISKYIDERFLPDFLENIQTKIIQYASSKNFRLIFFLLELLRGFMEGADMEITKKALKIAWLTSNLLDYEGQGQSFLQQKVIEIIKVSSNIVSQDRSGELTTDLMESIKRKIQKSGSQLCWLKEEKLIGIYLNLIAKVLRTHETHVSVQGIDALIFFQEILDVSMINKFKENIYGYLLRALSFQHTENFIKKVFFYFDKLLDQQIYPDDIQKYLFIYLIHTHNQYQSNQATIDQLMDYTHKLIEQTKTEYQFLKKWKQKILNDGIYEEEKLVRFINWKKSKSLIYLEYINKITEQQILLIYIQWKQEVSIAINVRIFFITSIMDMRMIKILILKFEKMRQNRFLKQIRTLLNGFYFVKIVIEILGKYSQRNRNIRE